MGYKFNKDTQEYEFQTVGLEESVSTDAYMVENIKAQYNQVSSSDLVYEKLQAIMLEDITIDQIQEDGSKKTVEIKGDNIINELSSNRQTFDEAGRNLFVATNHLLAFCVKNGMSVEDLINYAKNPEDERSKEFEKIIRQSKKEFVETTTCKNKETGHKMAGEFLAGYVMKATQQMDLIRKLPQENYQDIDYLQVLCNGQQSVIEQTVKVANEDIFDYADVVLKAENVPFTYRNFEYTAGITNGIVREANLMRYKGKNTPQEAQNMANAYASFNAIVDNFRKEYAPEKDINDIIRSYDADKYRETSSNPAGIEDPDLLVESIADSPERYALAMDAMLDKQYIAMGVEGTFANPGQKLNELSSNAEKEKSDDTHYKEMLDAAKNLKSMIKAGASKEQLTIAYREVQLSAANFLSQGVNVTDAQKKAAESLFKFSGTEKLGLQQRVVSEFTVLDADEVSVNEADKELEKGFQYNMAASQKKIYGKSSAEFTTLENTLKEYNELLASAGDNPTPEQSVKLYEYSKKIQSDAKKYLDLKEGKKLTANGKERYQLVKDINSHFAKREKDLFVQTIDAKYAEFIKNPSTKYVRVTDSGFVKMTLETVLKASDNFACMQAIEQIGVRDAVNVAAKLNTAKTREEFDAIIADKHSGIDVSSVDVIKANADFIFACSQKDRNELSQRQAHAREILDNVKFPEPDRAAYEQTAKANGIQIKDASGDAQYLANTQRILDTQKNLTLQYYGQMAPNTPRWAQTLYCKPGITDEEKAIIFEGVTNPKAAGKLYDFAFKELASINIDEMFKEKSMDEYAESFEKESYLRLLAWDCTNMFISVDNSIEKGDYVIDKTVYEQTKNYAHTISKNASNINTRIDQYQRPQSMVMDLAGKAEDTMKLMAAPDLSEADRNFAVLQMTANNPDDPIQDLEFAKQKYDFTTSCHENAMKHLGKANEAFLEFKKAVETKAKDTAVKANDFVQECAETIYYNMAKLEVNSFTKAGMENYFQPNVKEEKVSLLKNTFIQMIPNMKMDEIEELLHRTEPDPKRMQSFRDQLGMNMTAKAAEKEAQKDVQKKAPEAPKKEAPQGRAL